MFKPLNYATDSHVHTCSATLFFFVALLPLFQWITVKWTKVEQLGGVGEAVLTRVEENPGNYSGAHAGIVTKLNNGIISKQCYYIYAEMQLQQNSTTTQYKTPPEKCIN